MGINKQVKQFQHQSTIQSPEGESLGSQPNIDEFDVGVYFEEQDKINPKKARQQQIAYYILMAIIVSMLFIGMLCAIYLWMNNGK